MINKDFMASNFIRHLNRGIKDSPCTYNTVEILEVNYLRDDILRSAGED